MGAGNNSRSGGPSVGSANNPLSDGRSAKDALASCVNKPRMEPSFGGIASVCIAGHVMVQGLSCAACGGQRQSCSSVEVSIPRWLVLSDSWPVLAGCKKSGFGGNPSGFSLWEEEVSGFSGQSLIVTLPLEPPLCSLGPFYPPFLSEEVQLLLADFESDVPSGNIGPSTRKFPDSVSTVPPWHPSFRSSGGFVSGGDPVEQTFLVNCSSADSPCRVISPKNTPPASPPGERAVAQEVKKKKKKQAVRKKRVLSLALGAGVEMVDMQMDSDRALVSHARGRNLSKSYLCNWVADHWGSLLSTLPEVKKLMKGWFSLLMASKEDVDRMV